MTALLNCIWFLCGGAIGSLLWLVFSGIFSLITKGSPYGKACMEFVSFTVRPFSRKLFFVDSESDHHKDWLFALWLAAAVPAALLYFLGGILSFISLIGIPAGVEYFKAAKYVFTPLGVRNGSRKSTKPPCCQ